MVRFETYMNDPWKESSLSFKRWHFEIFHQAKPSTFTMSKMSKILLPLRFSLIELNRSDNDAKPAFVHTENQGTVDGMAAVSQSA